MHISTYLDDVVVWAPAKVNLFLEVLGKRPDGYHEIATLMVAVRSSTRWSFATGRRIDAAMFRCETFERAGQSGAAGCKAVARAHAAAGAGRAIRLIKRIPMAAGLAGGSADAAATLLGLNRLWQLGLSDARTGNHRRRDRQRHPVFLPRPGRLVYRPRRNRRAGGTAHSARFRSLVPAVRHADGERVQKGSRSRRADRRRRHSRRARAR